MNKYIFSVSNDILERIGDFNKLLAPIKRSTSAPCGLVANILASKIVIFLKCIVDVLYYIL